MSEGIPTSVFLVWSASEDEEPNVVGVKSTYALASDVQQEIMRDLNDGHAGQPIEDLGGLVSGEGSRDPHRVVLTDDPANPHVVVWIEEHLFE